MSGIFSLAYITFLEGIRSRALFGIFLIAILIFSVTVTLTDLFMRDIVKVAADLSLATISFSSLLMVLFVGNSLLSKDIDKRTIYMVISRPLSRGQYIVGKFLGLALLVFSAVVFLGIISSLPVYGAGLAYENPQTIFKWHIYFTAILFIALKLVLIASLTVFFSSFTSTSFISLMMTIITYMIGSTTELVKGLLDSNAEGINFSPAIEVIIKSVYYIFPNLASFDLKLQAAHGLPLQQDQLLWTFIYWLAYVMVTISASALIMSRREFP